MRTSRHPVRRLFPALVLSLLLASACGSRLSDNQLRLGLGGSAVPAGNSEAALAPTAGTASAGSVATPSGSDPAAGPSAASGGYSGGAATGTATTPGASAISAAGSAAGSTTGATPAAAAPAGGSRSAAAAAAGATSPGAKSSAAPGPGLPAPGQQPASPASDGTPIKLGTIGTFSGVLGAAMQPGLDAARAWTGYINAKGGLANHPVQLVVADDQGDPNQAVALIHRLVEQDKVLAIYGSMQPSTVQAILPYVNEKQMPIIGTCSCMNATATSPMVFYAGASDKSGTTWGHITGIFSGTTKRKAALFYCREAVTCSQYRDGIRKYDGYNGLKIVYETQISLAQPDFTAEVLAARNAGAEIIISVSENPTAIRIAKSAHRQNYPVILSTQHGGDDSRFIADGGEDVEGTVYSTPTAHWVTSPLMADYRESMKRYAPGAALGSLGSPMWVAGKMLERVAQGFPAHPSTADVLKGLWSFKNETLGGLIAPTTFVQGAPNNDLANICNLPLKVEHGKPVPTSGGPEQFVCAPKGLS